MNQLTLFNTYAICRDFMEDALVIKDDNMFRRYERLADKIYYRLNGRPFCPICGRTGGSWEHENDCARAKRRKELRNAAVRAAAVSPQLAVKEMQALTGLDHAAAADLVVDVMEWVS